MKKTFLYSLLIFLGVFMISTNKKQQMTACGGWDPDALSSYELFKPISFAEMSNFIWKRDSTKDVNIDDWKIYLKDDKINLQDIEHIVYKVSADDMQKIRFYVSEGKILDNKLKNNAMVKLWQKNKDLEAIDYLYFAKTCEPHTAYYDPWTSDEDRKRDITKMKWLMDEAKKYHSQKASNDFLKLRFAYQAIRLAHYTKNYDKALRFYDEMIKPNENKNTSIVMYWTLAHKAGALYHKGEKGEAAYLFSKVFDLCKSKQASAFLSFKVDSQKDWKKAESFCKNGEEKP